MVMAKNPSKHGENKFAAGAAGRHEFVAAPRISSIFPKSDVTLRTVLDITF